MHGPVEGVGVSTVNNIYNRKQYITGLVGPQQRPSKCSGIREAFTENRAIIDADGLRIRLGDSGKVASGIITGRRNCSYKVVSMRVILDG